MVVLISCHGKNGFQLLHRGIIHHIISTTHNEKLYLNSHNLVLHMQVYGHSSRLPSLFHRSFSHHSRLCIRHHQSILSLLQLQFNFLPGANMEITHNLSLLWDVFYRFHFSHVLLGTILSNAGRGRLSRTNSKFCVDDNVWNCPHDGSCSICERAFFG